MALLHEAKIRDPLADWLPLIRHASYQGWSKLKGDALNSVWRHIGAEAAFHQFAALRPR